MLSVDSIEYFELPDATKNSTTSNRWRCHCQYSMRMYGILAFATLCVNYTFLFHGYFGNFGVFQNDFHASIAVHIIAPMCTINFRHKFGEIGLKVGKTYCWLLTLLADLN